MGMLSCCVAKKYYFVLVLVMMCAVLTGCQNQHGQFEATGITSSQRTPLGAFLLKNGKVLLFGTKQPSRFLKGIQTPATYGGEIYDPETGQFSPTASFQVKIHYGKPVLLQDNTLLLVGGKLLDSLNPRSNSTSRIAIYNPIKGYKTIAQTINPRYEHALTVLQDGRVLITGGDPTGRSRKSETLNSAEIFDPKAKTSYKIPPMNIPRKGHITILLKDGKVLIAGGCECKQAELYNPVSNQFKLLPPGKIEDAGRAVLLKDGSVFLIGGFDPSHFEVLKEIEIFDPSNQTFKYIGEPKRVGRVPTAILLKSGKLLLSGGIIGKSMLAWSIKKTEIYDPVSSEFSPGPDMRHERSHHTATLLPDGRVLIVGGDNNKSPQANAEIFVPKGKFKTVSYLNKIISAFLGKKVA